MALKPGELQHSSQHSMGLAALGEEITIVGLAET